MLGGLVTAHVLQQLFIVCRNSLYTLVMRTAWLHFISAATDRAVLFKATVLFLLHFVWEAVTPV